MRDSSYMNPDLIQRLRDSADGLKSCDECNGECRGTCIFTEAADAIEELLAAVPKWISVEERLPEKDEMVIVYYSWTGQSGTVYKEVSLATVEEMKYCGNKLIGWMPLPEAPKEVE